mgnify:CR=1 FL=1
MHICVNIYILLLGMVISVFSGFAINKYIQYKKKYLDLKNRIQLGGINGVNPPVILQVDDYAPQARFHVPPRNDIFINL